MTSHLGRIIILLCLWILDQRLLIQRGWGGSRFCISNKLPSDKGDWDVAGLQATGCLNKHVEKHIYLQLGNDYFYMIVSRDASPTALPLSPSLPPVLPPSTPALWPPCSLYLRAFAVSAPSAQNALSPGSLLLGRLQISPPHEARPDRPTEHRHLSQALLPAAFQSAWFFPRSLATFSHAL